MTVVSLGSASGSYLMTVELYRLPDGEIHAVLQDMPVPVVESEATITARFAKAAAWMMEGSLSFMRQAVRFDDETRAANEEKP